MSNSLILALALTVLLATQVDAQSKRPLHFLTKQCNEDVIQVHLDPRPFQDLVGSDFSVVLEEGKARVQILVQDCSEYWIDGENLGPTQEIHVWLLIDGLKDVRPVVGAQQTRPTMTWLSLFDGSTNRRAREARMAAGSVQVPIESVSLDPPGPKRGGRIIFDRNLTYSWDVVSVVPPVRLVGVNHDVYTKDSAGNVFLNHMQAFPARVRHRLAWCLGSYRQHGYAALDQHWYLSRFGEHFLSHVDPGNAGCLTTALKAG